MNDTLSLSTTPLHDWHIRQGANMAGFAGYHMPLWYTTGIKCEHLSVIRDAGLFDTSHMAVITVSGGGGHALLQKCFSKDLDRCLGKKQGPLVSGRSVYGVFLQENGTVIDDAIVSLLGPDRYMVVVNCGMAPVIVSHLKACAEKEVAIVDYTDRIGKIDLQGPASAKVISQLLEDPDDTLNDMVYFSFKGDIFSEENKELRLKNGTSVLLSRTGYTGEFGFEMFVEAGATVSLWQSLLTIGASSGLKACGLAARDSLRAGAQLPLSHQDIGNWLFANTPWAFVLPWNETGDSFTKRFVGAGATLKGDSSQFTYGFAGYDPRKIPLTDATAVLDTDGNKIGVVLTCTTDMAIDRIDGTIVSIATPVAAGRPVDFKPRGLSCGFIKTTRSCRIGEQIVLKEGKRMLKVEIRDDVRPDRTARCPMKQMRLTA